MGRWSTVHQHLMGRWTNIILETINPLHVTEQWTTYSLAIIEQWTIDPLHFIERWTIQTKLLSVRMNIIGIEMFLKIIKYKYLLIKSKNNNTKIMKFSLKEIKYI